MDYQLEGETIMTHVSEQLNDILAELVSARDNEIMMASEVGCQYITDHNDRDAWRDLDRRVNKLAHAWDKMIARVEKWQVEAERIENSCDNFYGD